MVIDLRDKLKAHSFIQSIKLWEKARKLKSRPLSQYLSARQVAGILFMLPHKELGLKIYTDERVLGFRLKDKEYIFHPDSIYRCLSLHNASAVRKQSKLLLELKERIKGSSEGI
jgi:hypothetical protein